MVGHTNPSTVLGDIARGVPFPALLLETLPCQDVLGLHHGAALELEVVEGGGAFNPCLDGFLNSMVYGPTLFGVHG